MTTAIKTKNIDGVIELLKNIRPKEVTISINVPDSITSSQLNAETRAWLNADLSGELPPYDWGKEGMPKGEPVRYEPERGFIVVGGEVKEA